MEDQMREMVTLFSHPGFQRLVEAAERKWVSLGRFSGQVQVPNLTDVESQKISGLLGTFFPPEATATIKLSALENKLLSSRWAVGLETLVPLVTGRPLISKKQRQGMKASSWDEFCESVHRSCKREESAAWWNGIWKGSAAGSRAVRNSFDENREGTASWVSLCVRALDELPCWLGITERLPVFANRLSGDPHAFDADRIVGRWLYQALCTILELDAESAAEWKREVWQEAGVLLDEVSSFVTAVGLRTIPGDAWEAFFSKAIAVRMPLLLPLAFFQKKVGWEIRDRVFVVENPAVFETILDRWPDGRELPVLVCTSGQPSVAALRLLDALWVQGAEIWYSGDFDSKGIEMACSLQKRYGDQFVAWRMGSAEYLSVERGVAIEMEYMAAHLQMKVPWDDQLAEAMRARREKVFQESLVSLLLADLVGETKTVGG
ncbi:TIGR02679 family protein [Tumebacillus sp. ITR2]|uniref:TIGR02679 family protein n=1 Tax=Tumebacillus amylolyticus TaxID=2801339 RepID=A0ABS1JH87_9BACL|nr:TIGR02679 family protein [Tumebacillus amylolyticus]MBL0389479.1 TIGR02679 family protein [Tumebacillus amylolyticus]